MREAPLCKTSMVRTPAGFRWDRHWVITDESGKFLTQRQKSQCVERPAHLTGAEPASSNLTACPLELCPALVEYG